MTAAEYHQQQLEQQEQEDIAHGMNLNHGRFVGVARFIRDNVHKRTILYRRRLLCFLIKDGRKLI